jgi:diguanylate cyclase (GGDEF)-like protein/putative nucleotidyltransferase with HDIG domain
MVLVGGTAIAIVVASLLMGQRVLTAGQARDRAEGARNTLVDLRDELRASHVEYLQNRNAGVGAQVPPAFRGRFAAASARLQGLVTQRKDVTAEATAMASVQSAAADLGALVLTDPSGIQAGSPHERALVARADLVIATVERAMTNWLGLIDREVASRERSDERTIARLVATLGGLVGLLVVAGTALWFAIDRARRGAVAQIAAERDATAAVMASVQDGVAVLDGAGRIREVNERLVAITGATREDLLGALPPWATHVPQGFVGEADFDLVGAAGGTCTVILASSRLAADSVVGGWVHILKDVTDRKLAELELRERAAEQDVLRRVATVVARGAEPVEVFDLVAREVALMLGAEAGLVTRFDPIAERGVDVGVWVAPDSGAARPPARVPLDGGAPTALVYRTGIAVRVDDLSGVDVRTAAVLTGHGYRGGVAAPVSVGAVQWGAVAAMTVREGGLPHGAEDRISRLAELVGLTVANADARARLASQAATDPLTGLANHRSFHERLEHEVGRARAEDGELALVVFDLDRFKDVNDAFGHQIGDDVLAEAGRRLAGEARFGELVARVGGEEFAWILPGSDGINAWRAAERARRAVAESPFAGDVGYVTASAGVADLTQAADAGSLLRLADGALYWAKAHGRNVTLRYSPEVVQELSATERAERLARSQGVTALRALARAVDAKDPSTARHSERVAAVAVRLGSQLGWSQDRLILLEEAALLHDVGKIGVSDNLLLKPERLTPDERREVETHARLGAEIVSDVLRPEQVTWVRSHHERWDGFGYPDGISGSALPDGARILAVADAWDAMTSVRVYGVPRIPIAALAEVRSCAGSQFDPQVAEALQVLQADGRLTVTQATRAD